MLDSVCMSQYNTDTGTNKGSKMNTENIDIDAIAHQIYDATYGDVQAARKHCREAHNDMSISPTMRSIYRRLGTFLTSELKEYK